jgi:hypothetical protein
MLVVAGLVDELDRQAQHATPRKTRKSQTGLLPQKKWFRKMGPSGKTGPPEKWYLLKTGPDKNQGPHRGERPMVIFRGGDFTGGLGGSAPDPFFDPEAIGQRPLRIQSMDPQQQPKTGAKSARAPQSGSTRRRQDIDYTQDL